VGHELSRRLALHTSEGTDAGEKVLVREGDGGSETVPVDKYFLGKLSPARR
jgi:hypothetical protein